MERLVALVVVTPLTSGQVGIVPGAHIVFPTARLRALLGPRASSAEGILFHVQCALNDQLVAGESIERLRLPFQGFTVGVPSRIRGYSENQLLDTAVRTVSAFGTPDGLLDDEKVDRRGTLPTRRFIHSVRTVFSRSAAERRERFYRSLRYSEADPAMTIDYAYNAFLVQITSLPQTERHAGSLQKEAESKLLELDIAVNSCFRESRVSPTLLINTQALHLGLAKEEEKFANNLRDRIYFMAEQKNTRVFETESPEVAAQLLETFE